MEKEIFVQYGAGDCVKATLLEEVHDGILSGWNRLRMPDGHECYMSSRWCHSRYVAAVDLAVPADDHTVVAVTDWRGFLKAHWDHERNHLSTDCLEEFMTIFLRAYSNYITKKHEQEKILESNHQPGTPEPGRTVACPSPSGGRGSSASVSGGDSSKDRTETNALTKGSAGAKGHVSCNTVAASTKPRYTQLSLFPDL